MPPQNNKEEHGFTCDDRLMVSTAKPRNAPMLNMTQESQNTRTSAKSAAVSGGGMGLDSTMPLCTQRSHKTDAIVTSTRKAAQHISSQTTDRNFGSAIIHVRKNATHSRTNSILNKHAPGLLPKPVQCPTMVHLCLSRTDGVH